MLPAKTTLRKCCPNFPPHQPNKFFERSFPPLSIKVINARLLRYFPNVLLKPDKSNSRLMDGFLRSILLELCIPEIFSGAGNLILRESTTKSWRSLVDFGVSSVVVKLWNWRCFSQQTCFIQRFVMCLQSVSAFQTLLHWNDSINSSFFTSHAKIHQNRNRILWRGSFINSKCLDHEKSNTVDGRNPAPVNMVNIPVSTGFYTYQVVNRISSINSSSFNMDFIFQNFCGYKFLEESMKPNIIPCKFCNHEYLKPRWCNS